MPRVREDILKAAEKALEEYENEVEASELTRESKISYRDGARQFVRWLDGSVCF